MFYNTIAEEVVPTCKVTCFVKIDFQVGTTDLTIEGAYECKSDRLIVFELVNETKTNEKLFLVWNLENNCELRNFSTNENAKYVQGELSESGYLLMKRSYVNLDFCISFPFIKYDLTEPSRLSSLTLL
jgi:hypothetical protein